MGAKSSLRRLRISLIIITFFTFGLDIGYTTLINGFAQLTVSLFLHYIAMATGILSLISFIYSVFGPSYLIPGFRGLLMFVIGAMWTFLGVATIVSDTHNKILFKCPTQVVLDDGTIQPVVKNQKNDAICYLRSISWVLHLILGVLTLTEVVMTAKIGPLDALPNHHLRISKTPTAAGLENGTGGKRSQDQNGDNDHQLEDYNSGRRPSQYSARRPSENQQRRPSEYQQRKPSEQNQRRPSENSRRPSQNPSSPTSTFRELDNNNNNGNAYQNGPGSTFSSATIDVNGSRSSGENNSIYQGYHQQPNPQHLFYPQLTTDPYTKQSAYGRPVGNYNTGPINNNSAPQQDYGGLQPVYGGRQPISPNVANRISYDHAEASSPTSANAVPLDQYPSYPPMSPIAFHADKYRQQMYAEDLERHLR